MPKIRLLQFSVFIVGLLVGAGYTLADSNREEQAFQKRCTGCHGVDSAKGGPALRGVFGRAAGKAPGFQYSAALQAARFKWDQESLDRWLTDPDSVVPDTDMAFRLADKAERAEIIAY